MGTIARGQAGGSGAGASSGGRGAGSGQSSSKPVWLKGGRIYNHRMDGATEFGSFAAANAQVAAERAGLAAEHGLGAGGNVPQARGTLMQAAQRTHTPDGSAGARRERAGGARGHSAHGSDAASSGGESDGAPVERQWRTPDRGRGGRVHGRQGGAVSSDDAQDGGQEGAAAGGGRHRGAGRRGRGRHRGRGNAVPWHQM